jgi:alpha 1,2-mannosyltransferase
MASGKIEFGKVPEEMWSIPDFIDVDLMKRNMQKLEEENVVYGGVLSYRHMCRFNSGFFFRHPLMNQYEWYWRVEPGVKYYCDQK